MTELQWDQAGDRRFETGVDRGVLYLPDNSGVPWNGLTSVAEGSSRSSKPYYMDGVKFLDHEVLGEFAGKITALTYPDEFEALQGVLPFAPGVLLYDQPGKTFGLSYRSTLGNDISPLVGYRIHVLYNLRAVPDDITHTSQGSDVSPVEFGWSVTSTPPMVFGIRPTAHISFDTRRMGVSELTALEEALYGSDEADAYLPAFPDLIEMVTP